MSHWYHCICDKIMQTELQYLYTSLDDQGKSLFRALNAEYTSSHKFTGQV